MRTGQRPPDLGAVDKFRIGMGVLWRHQQLAKHTPKGKPPRHRNESPRSPVTPPGVWTGGAPPIHILLANPMGKKVPVAPILEEKTRFFMSKQGEQDSIAVRI